MEPSVKYTRVGLFVLVLGAALLGMILWLGKGDSRKEYDHYYVYVGESVTGLSVAAPVKYRGVDVGSLKKMIIDPENPEQVRLTLSVARGTPIKEDSVAFLEFQGLTWVALVNITGGRRDAPPLAARPGETYPVIKNVPSLYARLDQAILRLLSDPSLPRLVANLNQLTVNAQTLTDRENRDALKRLLAETANVARTLERMTGRVDAQLPLMLEQTRESLRALREVSNEAAQTGAMVERLIDQNRAGITAFTGETLGESGLLVTEVRQLTATLNRLAAQVEREPNALLFGKAPLPRGPGE